MTWLEATILGMVQGLAEFLPISSKGHLALTQQFFDRYAYQRPSRGEDNLFFAVILHVGTTLAILFHYRAALKVGLKGLAGSPLVAPEYRRPALVRLAFLVGVATLPAVVAGVLFKSQVEQAFTSPTATALGFLFTAFVLLMIEWISTIRKEEGWGPSRTTTLMALGVGTAQALALMPGVSRSGMTIAAALLVGMSRSWAVGFSLLISVPVIAGATAKELIDHPDKLDSSNLGPTLLGGLVALVVGYLAIIWLVRIVRARKLWWCSIYLMGLAAVVLAFQAVGLAPDSRGAPLPNEPRVESPSSFPEAPPVQG